MWPVAAAQQQTTQRDTVSQLHHTPSQFHQRTVIYKRQAASGSARGRRSHALSASPAAAVLSAAAASAGPEGMAAYMAGRLGGSLRRM